MKIEELTTVVTGGTPSTSKSEYWDDGNIPWLQSGCCQNCDVYSTEKYITQEGYENSSTRIMPANTVMIALTGATAGKVGYLNFEACGNQSITGILPCDMLNQRYLFYFLLSQRERILADCVGGAQAHISQGYVKNIKIPVLPLDEQEQVVTVLSKLSNVISMRKNEMGALDDFIKSRFVEMFGSIHDSKEYPYVAVKELTDVISGGTPSRNNIEYWENGTIPWVKTNELKNNVITKVDEHITELGLQESTAKLVPAGTVLVAMYGQGKTRGMTAYLDIEASTNQACACILPSDKINSIFLWKYFELSYDELRSLAQGAGQPNLNGNMIKNFQVLVPPEKMQKEFVIFVNQVDKLKSKVQESLNKTQLLFESLMQEYFG